MELWLFDLREKQNEIIKEDSKIWMLLSNWAELFGKMWSKKGARPVFPIKSINDLLTTVKTGKDISDEKEALKKFDLEIDKISKQIGKYMK